MLLLARLYGISVVFSKNAINWQRLKDQFNAHKRIGHVVKIAHMIHHEIVN